MRREVGDGPPKVKNKKGGREKKIEGHRGGTITLRVSWVFHNC